MDKLAFRLYLVFVVSWFLHVGTRIEALGTIRFDLLLVMAISGLLFVTSNDGPAPGTASPSSRDSRTRLLIRTMLVYCVVTLPFVQWPGTVLNTGLPDLIKSLVFFFFTAKLVTTSTRLTGFLIVFIGAMTFRVLEPLYLHATTGYWGSFATMANGEALDRLSGAPSDIINPNGLAFVILTVIPFFHFLGPLTRTGAALYTLTLPLLVWALLLTGSRSGLLGLAVVVGSIWVKSRRKVLMAAVVVIGLVVTIPLLSADLTDRYLSITNKDTKNASTAQGRLSGLELDLQVALRRPLFGHGLGTSLEANAHFASNDAPSHNLYLETAQELGIFGLLILVALLYSIASSLRASLAALKNAQGVSAVMQRLTDAVQVWLAMNILFSFASYGLRSYEWYLAAGFSEVLLRTAGELSARQAAASGIVGATATPMTPGRNPHIRDEDTNALWPERLARAPIEHSGS